MISHELDGIVVAMFGDGQPRAERHHPADFAGALDFLYQKADGFDASYFFNTQFPVAIATFERGPQMVVVNRIELSAGLMHLFKRQLGNWRRVGVDHSIPR